MGNFIQQYRRITIALAVFFILAALIFSLFSWPWFRNMPVKAPVPVAAVPVNTVNKPVRLVREGFAGNAAAVPVNADYTGRVSELYITEGQPVKAGQPLLKLEALDGQSSGTVTTNPPAEAGQHLQDNYDNALKKFTSYQKLYEQGAVARRDLENAAAALQEARRSLDSSRNGPSASAAAAMLSGSVAVKASIDGIVTGLSAALGKTVQAGQQLMALGSGQEINVVLRLEQNDLYLIHLGAAVTIEAPGKTVPGQVYSIYPAVEEQQISSFLAHVKLADQPEPLLEPGMAVTARIDTGKSAAVLAVPSGSVFQDEQGQSFIYAAVNGTAVRQAVSLGESLGDFTEVTSSLPPDMLVITGNPAEIKHGDAITVSP
ncbi:RND family efflux transporter, MFP subunit [Dendrosporobacter quercicolus]|uniref:RND family efflux transporter, MFP subunit n=1 Tax=Dendrosporobacter quercicolus TaxID=146817 RepID=A0A1G9TV20_9FIRM|nr:efflux RND transporter periplasmic adaptor subunit [Dendrosporobacter quercicolus]SDM51579.1 RND family efflux transporter, MFP subunit [Dendrosporobacter quercicolus]